jgi:hypothetical protein
LPANSGIENLELFSGAQFVKKGAAEKRDQLGAAEGSNSDQGAADGE